MLGKWINQFTQSRNLNWNSSKLLHEDRVTSNLVNYLISRLNYLKIIVNFLII
jgi:hypothetical protein